MPDVLPPVLVVDPAPPLVVAAAAEIPAAVAVVLAVEAVAAAGACAACTSACNKLANTETRCWGAPPPVLPLAPLLCNRG